LTSCRQGRWRQCNPPNLRLTFNGSQGVTSQKMTSGHSQ
jgi:hypothetical protein